MQRAFLDAFLSFFDDEEEDFDPASNPQSDIYDGRMIDCSRMHVYCWDARPWPAFPEGQYWDDGDKWEYGHWLTGRVEETELSPGAPGLDKALLGRLYTGEIRISNLRGFTRAPSVRIERSIPAPLTIRALEMEVTY
jgi:hypothetical protein